ncbi:2-succinyl-5-enolpyruvyl-6-hydroxy-3-cyclohexene-1-carboxylic-acid synthase [Spirosoma utsteinense]|uniref:2-succinyl-5-enolpyruvyl-6-hydroxy-3-cyclohexene-1-carboxylate synthase n=1 Tax=Spirosoma utsteinense TaxID=2585773 RepID=A0ABR6WAV0_9BACT|nr:2-succinyl-5-enolpyruvyl-6-hydroxy-3-cyclohexene-1-carboxylic-acid synthase [Spirosoma utsteinense]MBC3785793.1 2-succinyl-5-enolpyruvyl-6-hydroxy-3-cyclohexene-1-carboxylate synthase [Spirosoma utsteinense]MBC3793680.1 2-succinyl-5-enolpyruvyl-6-hydroxy-3-cyclohexene-1-carboxylate synthase [Spirosoma utsteinense]
MPILQAVVNIAELLHQKGITDVVVCPGSRSAPLTLAVARHPRLRVRVMADERSAGFVALGMAQQRRQPVAIICTSGSAVYNLAPAVAEAYFQQVPLLLLTADRPHEWLYQQDGQTIDQVGIFGNQVKRGYDLPADYTHADARWFIERTLNEAINLSRLSPAGPVHVNVPLREPFYPTADEAFTYERVRVIDVLAAPPTLPTETWHQLLAVWDRTERVLIAVGQLPCDPAMLAILKKFSDELGVPVVGEITGNIPMNDSFITKGDTFLSGLTDSAGQGFRPDLLITIGNSFLTRNLKTFFRQYPAQQHWHIQPTADRINDSFQSLTTLIPAEPLPFLEKLFADVDYQRFLQGDDEDETNGFLSHWQAADRLAAKLVQQTVSDPGDLLTDWSAVQLVLDQLPEGSVLHLANSMPVRYANLCGIHERQHISVWGNRGVSGIDGCLSTALGAALITDQLVTVLIGDVAFFYDRNALWSAPVPPNLRIILLNNDSGHIFRIIDGPSRQPELEAYFETPHGYTAKRTAEDAGIRYQSGNTIESLRSLLPDFFQPGPTAALLELTTDKLANQQLFTRYKENVKTQISPKL